MATMKQRENAYKAKYGNIPLDYKERLSWLYETLKIDDVTANKIIAERSRRIENIYYNQLSIILYLVPEGAKRPRYRRISRSNILEAAKGNEFIHVYSPGASQNHAYMKRVVESELDGLTQLICTPCDVHYRAFIPTPSTFNRTEVFMAEVGLSRPVFKPDWDNIGKLYSDMYNSNIWLDDALTVTGRVDKFYSVLPRVEIDLLYMNALYNKYQYDSIVNRKDYIEMGGTNLSYV